MESQRNIRCLNLTAFSNDVYVQSAFDGTGILENPDCDVQVVSRDEVSTDRVSTAISEANLLFASGSMENVGKPSDHNEHILEPNLDSHIVKTVVQAFNLLIIQTLNGDPEAERTHGILNCFSMQAFAWALTLVAHLKTHDADLQQVQDRDDLQRLYPLEQIALESEFPIIQNPVSQLGMYPIELSDRTHWLFQDSPDSTDVLFLHNQSVDLELFRQAVSVLEQVKILASRRLSVQEQSLNDRLNILTLFEFSSIYGLQSHIDYGEHGAAFAKHALKPNLQRDPHFFDRVFYPGPGGCHTGKGDKPRSALDLKSYLFTQRNSPLGVSLKQRLISAALD